MAFLRRAVLTWMLALLAAAPAAAVTVGDRAPEFSLPDRGGQTVTLANGPGRIAIVDFWASWCMPCAPVLPVLDAMAHRYEGRAEVFAIDIDQSRAKADAFLAEHVPNASPHLHVLIDPAAEVLARYGAPGMPALFVVGPDGTVRLVETGYSPERLRVLDETVESLLRAP